VNKWCGFRAFRETKLTNQKSSWQSREDGWKFENTRPQETADFRRCRSQNCQASQNF